MTRPKQYTTVDELESIIDEYFAECQELGRPLTISGLAVALGMDRDSVLNYGKKEGYEAFFGTVKKAKSYILARQEESLVCGKNNPAGLIFSMKNNYNWADKHEIEHTGDIRITLDDDLDDLAE